jgi:hypothetical protein
MNYQYWFGTEASKYGYGAMLEGFRSGLPADVQLHDQASVAVLMYTRLWFTGFCVGNIVRFIRCGKPHSYLKSITDI